MNLKKFESEWVKEKDKNPDYFIVELKNGAGIFTHAYKIVSPVDIQLYYAGEFIAYLRINMIESVRGFKSIKETLWGD